MPAPYWIGALLAALALLVAVAALLPNWGTIRDRIDDSTGGNS